MTLRFLQMILMPYAQEFHKIYKKKKEADFSFQFLKPVVIKRAVVIKDIPGDDRRNLPV